MVNILGLIEVFTNIHVLKKYTVVISSNIFKTDINSKKKS